jgi:asparagine synthase (glutamine-hydrolysing)
VSAIAGYIGRSREYAEGACAQLLGGLAELGTDPQLRSLEAACFGRLLHRTVPEDDFDKQPLLGPPGRSLFVCDARIDNRDELAADLGIDSGTLRKLSDADVLHAAWERWGLGCFDRLLGDVALAVWQSDKRRLLLARSASSSKPLFWAVGEGFVAFASLPQGLHQLPEVPKSLNLTELIATAAGLPFLSDETSFRNVRRVRHGYAVQWCDGQISTKALWDLKPVHVTSTGDYAYALRSELDRAVRARMRRRSGPLASHLSAGRDSSAVAATAALLLRETGEELIALTGAPRIGFSGPDTGRIIDETGLAAETASLHSNMRHFCCRSDPVDLAAQITRLNRAHFAPILNIRSIPWWTSVHDKAVGEGAAVVLGAGTGNLSISAGGPRFFGELLRSGVGTWALAALGCGGLSPSRWRSVVNFSFGPLVPPGVYTSARRLLRRDPNRITDVPFLHDDLRQQASELLSEHVGDPRPPRSEFEYRRELLLRRDIGEKQTLAMWGIDLRDPTADRRLVELCLAMPPKELISGTSDRPAYERAFADRLPMRVLKNRRRGHQNADWFEHFRKDTVEGLFRDYRRHAAVRAILDFDYIDRAVSNWPTRGWADSQIAIAYGFQLMSALSLASFVSLHFPD